MIGLKLENMPVVGQATNEGKPAFGGRLTAKG